MSARLVLADAVRAATYPMDQLAECLFAATVLQVHMTRLAATLDLSRLHRTTDGTCPSCGSPPVASMIVKWPNASRARYCVFPFCATAWNSARIKCTACRTTGGVEYFPVEEQSKDITVRDLFQLSRLHQAPAPGRPAGVEPIADDIASLGLDLLVQQEGFRRITANPLLVMPATPRPGTH